MARGLMPHAVACSPSYAWGQHSMACMPSQIAGHMPSPTFMHAHSHTRRRARSTRARAAQHAHTHAHAHAHAHTHTRTHMHVPLCAAEGKFNRYINCAQHFHPDQSDW